MKAIQVYDGDGTKGCPPKSLHVMMGFMTKGKKSFKRSGWGCVAYLGHETEKIDTTIRQSILAITTTSIKQRSITQLQQIVKGMIDKRYTGETRFSGDTDDFVVVVSRR